MGVKEYIMIAILAVCVSGGFLAGYKWKAAQLATCEAGLQSAILANMANDAAIKKLRTELSDRNNTCNQRLAAGNIKTSKIENLLNLCMEGKNEKPAVLSSDSYLGALNGMWAENGYSGGYCSADNPQPAAGTVNEGGSFLYCFASKQDAVTLMRNIVMLDADRKDCRDIVTSLTPTK